MFYRLLIKISMLSIISFNAMAVVSSDTNYDFSKVPPDVADYVFPNVLLNMSVETPMGGAAYPDHPTDLNNDGDSSDVFITDEDGVRTEVTGSYTIPAGGKVQHECGGRSSGRGICYYSDEKYLGYFDSNKCYTYDSTAGYFEPSSVTADHSCSGEFSGNFLNWASMTAIDEFIWTMTGGKRLTDSKSLTVVGRANKINDSSWFPDKHLNAGLNVNPNSVTPWGDSNIYIRSQDLSDRIQFGTSAGGSNRGVYNIRVKACDVSVGLEENCKTYSDGSGSFWYKPEGLIQKNSHRMRFGVMAYTNHDVKTRDGGVLRAAMKFAGPILPDGSVNPQAEFGLDGLQLNITDPDSLATGGVTKSGVINYINEFYINDGYKSYDPLGELYYQCIRYYKGLPPTEEHHNSSPPDGAFPIISTWTDPIQYHCQNNYIIAINDVFAWRDKRLPGTHFNTAADVPYVSGGWGGPVDDFGEPSDAASFTDASTGNQINVADWTNDVGDAEGLDWSSYEDGIVGNADDYLNGPINLGEILAWGTGATKPHANERRNSYYAAGLAYYAHTQDLRGEADMPGKQTVNTFMIDTQEYNSNPLTGERNVLYLTGKYGGFIDVDEDGTFDSSVDTWDEDNDGQPDNYILASDPSRMVEGLKKAFSQIKSQFRAGSAVAISPVTRQGEGAVYQAFYEPSRSDGTTTIQWMGTLQSFLIDTRGQVRQDDGDGVMEDYATDKVIQSFIDYSTDPLGVLMYKVYTPASGHEDDIEVPQCLGDSSVTPVIPVTCSVTAVEPKYTTPLWSARKTLHDVTDFTANRSYNSVNPSQRHILTWHDADLDGVVDSNEQKAFTPGTVNGSFFPHFDVNTETAADNIVKFVRGDDGLGNKYRSRSVDYNGDGTARVERLGDIIHSSPKVVGAPFERHDLLYGDTSYAAFRAKYANRRQVVYVGANDGLLHAFNAGFYDRETRAFKKQYATETAHALGAELWAYAPKNLLPHLKWLTIPDYRHVYYMDGPVRLFDAKIFTPDATHPGGWGTLLLAGMRYGGGNRTVDVDQNGLGVGNDHDFHSAYVLMDVTDPESPPVLLAEINGSSFNAMGYTINEPVVASFVNDASGVNEWFLVLGNGPDDLTAATSSGRAGIYVLDLKTMSYVTGFNPYTVSSKMLNNAFMGGAITVDWDDNYLVDSIYVATAGNNAGRLLKIDTGENHVPNTTNWTVSILQDTSAPIIQKPSLSVDEDGRRWIFSSTGRYETIGDKTSTTQNYMYGIKDDNSGATTLQDVHDLKIYQNGEIRDTSNGTVAGLPDFGALEARMESSSYKGWRRLLDTPPTAPGVAGTEPSERVIRRSTVTGGAIFTPSYSPNDDLCVGGGSSKLYGLYYKTGTGHPKSILSLDASDTITTTIGGVTETSMKVNEAAETGSNFTSEASVHDSFLSDGTNDVTLTQQTSKGELVRLNPDLPIEHTSGELTWRELRNEK